MLATTIHKSNTTPHHQSGATTTTLPRKEPTQTRVTTTSGFPPSGRRGDGPVVSKPNSVSGDLFAALDRIDPAGRHVCRAPTGHPLQGPALISQPRTPHRREARGNELVLLRKEVIQPHLPVRLPCYDFVPIADPTFDSSPPYGLGHWLRVLPTFMT
jgi:hypothetical protein